MRIPRYTNNGFLHLPTSMSGLGIRSIAYEVAAARLRVYNELKNSFQPFINESIESEVKSVKKLINTNYDEGKSAELYYYD
ncbi:hypothetical protein GJ496_003496 [Pomphorhynchus laevis]|nr:hypothetical protein GJ496_009766 [Pomphorhynchus laevis]KAI0981935.1 hypothetical protein GJ496_009773 [Pomphorhynchus laevis]KAI0982412.1 hypothetical protein GJ496_003496 [Pomphorhynchus laevis]